MKRLSGSCLCGTVKVSVPDQFTYFGYCHCTECQKASGSAFSSFAGVRFEDMQFIEGSEEISYFEKSENATLGFCRRCGSNLFSKRSDTRIFNLRAGVLNDQPSQRPTMHIHMNSNATWHTVADDLEQFEAGPDPEK